MLSLVQINALHGLAGIAETYAATRIGLAQQPDNKSQQQSTTFYAAELSESTARCADLDISTEQVQQVRQDGYQQLLDRWASEDHSFMQEAAKLGQTVVAAMIAEDMGITVLITDLEGDTLIELMHTDGQYVVYRVAADPTVGQFTTYDVSSEYADYGHDTYADRDLARSLFTR